ncbi:carbohydrate kinase family protein [Halorubrum sp. CBA1125]|uniref:carbohydrate kinase family protein n=1 Tax=Halorubrum sp. CBA1125 TaxID=2668072 RepID=UPI00135DE3ED|nr:carbohydrate kinase family protein [Halorubrum sp. CBA1125]MUW15692.1 carbohydrate kinase family protein [Halorubrum sp. CBA1125]
MSRDEAARPAADEGRSPRIVSIGAAAVDEWYAVSNLPEPDGGAFAREVTTAFGGVGANVAVALDRLGRDVALVSRVGDDAYGRRALDNLADTGVDATHVATGSDASTRSVILRAPDGERAIVTAGESFRRLRLDAAARAAVADADAVFLTAYAPDAVSRAVLDTIDSGPAATRLAFDLSGAVEELVGRGTEPATIHRLIHRADLLVAGAVAAPAYFGSPEAAVERIAAMQAAAEDGTRERPHGGGSTDDGGSAADAGSVADAGWPRAVLTRGADGMTAVVDGEPRRFDAFDVDVEDTTGASDAFIAGLIDRWIATDAGVVEGIRFAAAVAAINCTARFTQPGLPTRDAVAAFLAERPDEGPGSASGPAGRR